jgi:hypothetical protein
MLKLIEFLEQLAPSKFNFNDVVTEYKNECGSVCCAIGWTPNIFPEMVSWRNRDVVTKYSQGYIDVAVELFNIDYEWAEDLFTPDRCFDLDSFITIHSEMGSNKANLKNVVHNLKTFLEECDKGNIFGHFATYSKALEWAESKAQSILRDIETSKRLRKFEYQQKAIESMFR